MKTGLRPRFRFARGRRKNYVHDAASLRATARLRNEKTASPPISGGEAKD